MFVVGLFVVGEIIGGVYGKNCLGGNAFIECAVFGRFVGTNVNIVLNTDVLFVVMEVLKLKILK